MNNGKAILLNPCDQRVIWQLVRRSVAQMSPCPRIPQPRRVNSLNAQPDYARTLARFAGKLTQEDINITLGYQTSTKGSRKVSMVLAVSDLAKADRIR